MTGSGWAPGWESRREWGSKSVGQCHPTLADLWSASRLSFGQCHGNFIHERKWQHRPAWPKPSPSDEQRGTYVTPSEDIPGSSGWMLPRRKLTPGWSVSAPRGRKKLELSGSKRKQSILEKSQDQEATGSRSSSDSGPTCFDSENLWRAGVKPWTRKLKIETQGCFWEVSSLEMEPVGDKCRHWAMSSFDGTQRTSLLYVLHPPTSVINLNLVQLPAVWFWAIYEPFLKPSFPRSRMNAWTASAPVPFWL